MKQIALLVLLFRAALTLEAQKPSLIHDWPAYGGTLAGQRYSAQAQITPANVARLSPAWTFHTHVFDTPSKASNARASFEATPVLWDKTLYFDTPFNAVFAIDAATGVLRWAFDPKINRDSRIYIVTSRGVALWHASSPQPGICGSNRVFVATLDRRLIARDARTGAPCVQFGDAGAVDLAQGVEIETMHNYEFTSPPTVVGDVIVLGSTVADNQSTFVASGVVRGFSALTGKQLWAWEPLPWSRTSKGRISGSGNAWSVLSADQEHDLIFVPTGSASVDYYGGTRPGDNRDANSIVALQASTGRRIWAFQLVHHDLWDYDTPSQPVLFTFRDGTPAVAVTTKTNMVYVFNRLTGAPLYPIEERPVPASTLQDEKAWPTQPFSTLPSLAPLQYDPSDIHLANPADEKYCKDMLVLLDYKGIFTPPSRKGALVYPGNLGGANWGSAAFDPASGMLFTRVSVFPFIVREKLRYTGLLSHSYKVRQLFEFYQKHAPAWLTGEPPDLPIMARSPDAGEEGAADPQDGTRYKLWRSGILSPGGSPCAPQPFGLLVAINLNTGQKAWSVPHGQMAPGVLGSIGAGGPIVTRGGLVFVASSNDANLRAYDSTSGKEVWRQSLPAPANATPMTYAIDGRQYVVIAAGGHGFVGEGKSDQIVAFALPSLSAKKPSASRKY